MVHGHSSLRVVARSGEADGADRRFPCLLAVLLASSVSKGTWD